jgi:hypothetical protein
VVGNKLSAKSPSPHWSPCSVELKEYVFPSLRAAVSNLPELPNQPEATVKQEESEVWGPLVSDKDGSVYVGSFEAGKRSGRGLLVSFSGNHLAFIYEGQFQNDQPQGNGRTVFSNGDWFLGHFLDGKACGMGIYRNHTAKCTIEGKFENDQPNGECIEVWDDRSRYEGSYCNGKKHGKGMFVTKHGTLKGEFQNGHFHGEGMWKSKKDRIYEGQWEQSVLKSPAKIHLEDTYYEGNINHELLPDGEGFVLSKKQKIHGTFRNGLMHGQANRAELQTGKAYVGYYENGILGAAQMRDSAFSDPDDTPFKPVEPKHPVLIGSTPNQTEKQSAPAPKDADQKKKGCAWCC